MSREKILARIREALSVPTDDTFLHSRHEPPPADFRTCMMPGGRTPEEQLFLLSSNLEALKVEFVHLSSLAAAGVWLHVKAVELGWKKAAYHSGVRSSPMAEAMGVPLLCTSSGYAVEELETCPVAVTECDALVAQTGGILVTSMSAGGRSLSVLPHHHVVIASLDQIVGDMSDAFAVLEKRYAPNYPSYMGFINGASRTGDIERILVLGAHGPKNLTVIVVDSLVQPTVVELE